MSKVTINEIAPDFELNDLEGNRFHLADILTRQNVLLIFNRGFI